MKTYKVMAKNPSGLYPDSVLDVFKSYRLAREYLELLKTYSNLDVYMIEV